MQEHKGDRQLPRVRRLMEDPQSFLDSITNRRIVLDEVHRLDNPSELLKIAADHYPELKIIATGSSTLGASARFKDTLTGRKSDLLMTLMTISDLADFGREDLRRRFLRGGLPPFFLEDNPPERWFQEWLDAFWANDIQELFRLERRHSFQKFLELLMTQSGGDLRSQPLRSPLRGQQNDNKQLPGGPRSHICRERAATVHHPSFGRNSRRS